MRRVYESGTHAAEIDGVALRLAWIGRDGPLAPIVFLHGFGSTKEDYADIGRDARFAGRGFLAYDAPGGGETACSDCAAVDIPFLVATALEMVRQAGVDRFHLVGHSMGGLTALMLAHAHPERVLSFANIEGNVAPEDCFLSRQIVERPGPDPDRFFDGFVERTRAQPGYGSALYAASLRHKVRAAAAPSIFSSMVALSDAPGLLDKFTSLPCPKLFMYGAQNATLSYLGDLDARGVRLAEIPQCGHWPMYSNPPAMWAAIAAFIGAR